MRILNPERTRSRASLKRYAFWPHPEARQWRETLARRDEKIKIVPEPQGVTFAEELFGVSA
jgi:hypothetical protein